MPRTSKAPEIRRQELLDAALDLFLEQGVDRTAVSHIVRKVSVAQGTFYYHFDSKDELVDALAERLAEPIGQLVSGLADDEDSPVPQRVAQILSRLLDVIESSGAHLAGLVRPGNEGLHQKVGDAMRGRLQPVLEDLVARGQAEGSLDAQPVHETVELILASIAYITRTLAHGGPPERVSRLREAAQQLAARGLGITPTT